MAHRGNLAVGARLLLLAVALAATPAHAAPYGRYNRPQDAWKVVETQHFRFCFTDDTPRAAAYLMGIADETFERLNAHYQLDLPEKIKVTVVGYTSFANGFADFVRNHITIFTTAPDFHNRSRVPWLRNVFTHELSHILSLNAATPWYRRLVLMLGLGVHRSSGAQTSLRVPVYGRAAPHWYAEGVAQFDTFLLGRDAFDENRAALQRAAWEDGLFYSLRKLAFFGGEQWYNTGLSFLSYLEDRFGSDVVHRLFAASGGSYHYLVDGVFEEVLNLPLSLLERDFRAHVAERFAAHVTASDNGRFDGAPVAFEDHETPYVDLTSEQRTYSAIEYRAVPLRYHDGKLFFLRGSILGVGDVSAEGGRLHNLQMLGPGVMIAPHTPTTFLVLRQDHESPSLVPYFHRPQFESPSLFLTHLDGRERVLLPESRLHDFDFCAERSEIAAVYNDGDGSLKLALLGLDRVGTEEVSVRDDSWVFPLPEQPFDEVRNPRYSPDCSRVYFSRRVGDDHDVLAYDFDSSAVVSVSAEPSFELYPYPTDDGVYYVSARDGSMDVYYRARDGQAPVKITDAVTGHHHVVAAPEGTFFARLYGTGLQTHFQAHPPAAAAQTVDAPSAHEKGDPTDEKVPLQPPQQLAEAYQGWWPSNALGPIFVPMAEVELDTERSYGSSMRLQAGLEAYVEDQLGQHSLVLRGLAGDRSSVLLGYRNRMTPVTFFANAGASHIRYLYVYEGSQETYEHVTDYRWGYLNGGLTVPLNLFYSVSLVGNTIRDIGSTVGASARPYRWGKPRFSKDLFGLILNYVGVDRNDPTYSPREINKRGYRRFELEAYYGREQIHPELNRIDPSFRSGTQPFWQAQLSHTEYIALPKLLNGFFDHTLQIDLQLGYISEPMTFLPFIGGGRLYSLASPELNNSVGFVGYSFFSITGETLANLAASYRFPIARTLGLSLGPLFMDDIYGQIFTSWGNIWSYTKGGKRQVPTLHRARNGRHVLGDVGMDVRLGHFLQETETNVGTTLRLAYRLVPFSRCPSGEASSDPDCLATDGRRGLLFYFMVGGGF